MAQAPGVAQHSWLSPIPRSAEGIPGRGIALLTMRGRFGDPRRLQSEHLKHLTAVKGNARQLLCARDPVLVGGGG